MLGPAGYSGRLVQYPKLAVLEKYHRIEGPSIIVVTRGWSRGDHQYIRKSAVVEIQCLPDLMKSVLTNHP